MDNDNKDGDKEPQNKIASMKAKDLAIEVIQLKEELGDVKKNLKQVTKERDEANAVIAGDIRSRKINEITKLSKYTVEDCDKLSLEQLDGTLETIRMTKRSFKPVSDVVLRGQTTAEALDEIYANTPWGKKGK